MNTGIHDRWNEDGWINVHKRDLTVKYEPFLLSFLLAFFCHLLFPLLFCINFHETNVNVFHFSSFSHPSFSFPSPLPFHFKSFSFILYFPVALSSFQKNPLFLTRNLCTRYIQSTYFFCFCYYFIFFQRANLFSFISLLFSFRFFFSHFLLTVCIHYSSFSCIFYLCIQCFFLYFFLLCILI